MRWTLWRQAGSARRTKPPQRTVKSCGPGAATPGVKLCGKSHIATVAKRPLTGESTKQLLKTICAGKAGMSG